MTIGHRLTSRILLYDEAGRILLFLTKAPDTRGLARWLTPGGGVDPGESHAEAAIRELYEETGMVITDPGPVVWSHDFDVIWNDADHDTGHAEFYVQHTTAFEPSTQNWTDDERIDVLAHRWWPVDELATTSEPYEPPELPRLAKDHEGDPMPETPLPEYTLEALELADRVVVEHFTKEDAYELGIIASSVIQERGLSLAVDIVIGDDLVFRAKFARTNIGNDEWLAGKAAVARHFGVPSLVVRFRYEASGVPFTDLDLDHDLMRAHGGSIPIFVGDELAATITMSGEEDVVDHQACAEAVLRYLATR